MQKSSLDDAAAPAAKKPKKAAAPKAAPKTAVPDSFPDFEVSDAPPSKTSDKRLSVERIYQKKSQLEHILLRPDTYIGSVESVTQVRNFFKGIEIVKLKTFLFYSAHSQSQ